MTQVQTTEKNLPLVEYSAGCEVTLARMAKDFFADEKTQQAFLLWKAEREGLKTWIDHYL